MTPLILLALLVLGPAAFAVLLRINAAVLFMSLCVGEVLVQFMANDAGSFMAVIGSHNSTVSGSTIKLVLLLMPPALTALFMFRSVRGKTKAMLNIVPAVGTGLLTALLVKPLLSASYQHTLEQSSLWHQFVQGQTIIVGAGALLTLFFLWFQRAGGEEQRKFGRKRV